MLVKPIDWILSNNEIYQYGDYLTTNESKIDFIYKNYKALRAVIGYV